MPDQKIIILEGLDGVGKSNIAAALSRELQIPSFKNSNEHGCFEKMSTHHLTRYAGLTMLSFLGQTDYSVIFDREYPSEFAYAKAYHRHTDQQILAQLDNGYTRLGALLIYCCKTNHGNFQDDLIGRNMYPVLEEAYKNFLGWTTLPYMVLDTTNEDLAYQLSTIQRFLAHHWGK